MAAAAQKTSFVAQRNKWKTQAEDIAELPGLSMFVRTAILNDSFISMTFDAQTSAFVWPSATCNSCKLGSGFASTVVRLEHSHAKTTRMTCVMHRTPRDQHIFAPLYLYLATSLVKESRL